MIIESIISTSRCRLEARARLSHRAIEVLLLWRDSENHEPTPDPCIDRPDLAGALLRAQLEEIYLALQRLHVGRRQVRPEILQLPDNVVYGFAIAARFHVLEVEHRIAVEVPVSPHWPGPRRKKEFEPHDDQTKVLIRTIDELYRLPESNTVVPLLEDWKWRDKMETAAEKQRYLEPMLARVSRRRRSTAGS